MSDAKVKFLRLDGSGASVGAEPTAPGEEVRFSFKCPKHPTNRCGGLLIAGRSGIPRDGQNQNGGRAQWDWNGDRERPTFSPSVNCGGCWHGYIENGRCVDTAHQEEPEPGAGGVSA